MSRSRSPDDPSGPMLLLKLLAQFLAAAFLSFPGTMAHFAVDDPALLARHGEVLTGSVAAVPVALWVVLRHKRVHLGIGAVLLRTVLLLALATAVTMTVIGPDPFGVAEHFDPGSAAPVLVLLWLWVVGWRAIDRWRSTEPSYTDPKIDPKPYEIWFATVPFLQGSYEAGEQREKDRPCLVIETGKWGARVLKITSVDRSTRHDHLRMPAGWNPEDPDKPNWLAHTVLVDVPYEDFRRFVTTCPDQLRRSLV